MVLTKIEIYARGKNKDEVGNPYYAYRAILHYSYVSFFNTITIIKSMSWGDSGENDCLMWALQGINEAINSNIRMDDGRIEMHYKTVYSDRELEHPETWKV